MSEAKPVEPIKCANCGDAIELVGIEEAQGCPYYWVHVESDEETCGKPAITKEEKQWRNRP
jgi:hypothetical protein